MSAFAEIMADYERMSESQRAEIDAIVASHREEMIWCPNPGPQTECYFSPAQEIYYGGAAGGGKMLALDTPIPMPAGWTVMGELKPGDVIFDERGAPTRVELVSEIKTPKSYELTFDDGQKITACADHLWLTLDVNELAALTRRDPVWRAARRAKRPSRSKGTRSAAFVASLSKRNAEIGAAAALDAPTGTVRTTQQIVDTLLTKSGRRNHAIPVAGALQCADLDLPVDPYVLGAWLGDGTNYNGGFTSADEQIWREIEACGYEITHASYNKQAHYIRALAPQLKALGVLRNKHVPAIYLRGSEGQRLALLQGLMDTDGHATLGGGCEFDNTNHAIALAVHELVLSLGIKATIGEGVATLYGRSISPRWRVKFTTDKPVFRLKRKLDRLKPTRRTQRFRYIVDAIEVDPVPMRCIRVDSPSRLYLAGRGMIPTHNTDLMLGTALNSHDVSQIFRLQHNDRVAIVRRLGEMLTGRPGKPKGYNANEHAWTGEVCGKNRIIEFGALSEPDAWMHYMGRPASAKLWDELPQFSRKGVTTVNQWLRSVDPAQRCRFIGAGNPPMAPEQFWVVEYWAPWLDKHHSNPAKPGELRWFITDEDDHDIEVDADYIGYTDTGKVIRPVSRTFIRADLDDNEELAATGYGDRLAAGPLGKILLDGIFDAGVKDHGMQLIPTEWVMAAQMRWELRKDKDNGPITAVGVDPNGGGKDEFGVMARRRDFFEAPALDSQVDFKRPMAGAAFVIANVEGDPRLMIDCTGGWGNGIVEWLSAREFECVPLVMSKTSIRRTYAVRELNGVTYGFANKRAEYMWGLREALDPARGSTVCLPPGRRIVAELTLPRWQPKRVGGETVILIEPKEDMIKRYGKSPTILDCAAYCWGEPDDDERKERKFKARQGGRIGVTRPRSPIIQAGYATAKSKWGR